MRGHTISLTGTILGLARFGYTYRTPHRLLGDLKSGLAISTVLVALAAGIATRQQPEGLRSHASLSLGL